MAPWASRIEISKIASGRYVHFHYAGLADEEMFGQYVTEHEGFTLFIFPINKRLRSPIPFRAPEEKIEKTYQGTVLLFHWRFLLKPGEKKRLPLTLSCGGI